MIHTINTQEAFEQFLDMECHPGQVVLVQFSAVWCGPCKKISPHVEAIASQHENEKTLQFIKIDLDEAEQERLWRQAGEVTFVQHREIPLFWIPVEATVNSQIVADWEYPGGITGAWTHVVNIKPAK